MQHPGIRLKQLREERGLTEQEVIKKIYPGKEHCTDVLLIKAWEKGITNLYDSLLIKLSIFFDVSIMYLLGFTSIKQRSDKYNIL